MAAPSYVFTIARVARMLGEDEALLEDIALMSMDPEDGRLTIIASTIRCPRRPSRRLVADLSLDKAMLQDVLSKKV